jgi:hypothetical protein
VTWCAASKSAFQFYCGCANLFVNRIHGFHPFVVLFRAFIAFFLRVGTFVHLISVAVFFFITCYRLRELWEERRGKGSRGGRIRSLGFNQLCEEFHGSHGGERVARIFDFVQELISQSTLGDGGGGAEGSTRECCGEGVRTEPRCGLATVCDKVREAGDD